MEANAIVGASGSSYPSLEDPTRRMIFCISEYHYYYLAIGNKYSYIHRMHENAIYLDVLYIIDLQKSCNRFFVFVFLKIGIEKRVMCSVLGLGREGEC